MPKEKLKTVYVCTSCGEVSSRWMGRCPSCGEWNTMTEDVVKEATGKGLSAAQSNRNSAGSGVLITAKKLSDISATEERSRIITGIGELDRVLGGGIVLGSVVLLGGEPGAGKSTLLLQLCGAISEKVSVLYITGEESVRQIKLRAMRLKVHEDNIMLASETDIGAICDLIMQTKPGVVVIDSIQTMHCMEIASS
ncbi:MAG: ATPase domain-containing protein, partial [Ruthenibacterium sp.]